MSAHGCTLQARLSGRTAAREVGAKCLGDDLLLGPAGTAVDGPARLTGQLAIELQRQTHVQLHQGAITGRFRDPASDRPAGHLHPIRSADSRNALWQVRSSHHAQLLLSIVTAGQAPTQEHATTSPETRG